MGIVADLIELFPDTLTVTPGYTSEFGDFVASGAVLTPSCHIEGVQRLIRGANGQEVAVAMQVFVAGHYNLTVNNHRYTLPTRFSPRTDLRAVGIDKVDDEGGEHHEVVLLPPQ